jgi:N,N-dimethylformamidase beta subunit-like protein
LRKKTYHITIIITSVIIVVIATSWFLSNNQRVPTSHYVKRINIALVRPTFTAAAYHRAFYKFYFVYASIPHARKNITSELNLLSTPVTNLLSRSSSASSILYLTTHMRAALPTSDTHVLTDEDVDAGSIFLVNGSNKYDILILGHQEYVTQQEYDNLKRFVANGGTMILLDGNIFYAQVKYDRNTHTITLVKGHGWAFNGKSAWRSIGERWANETSQWIGSNYLCYSCSITLAGNVFQYKHHEEQYVSNPNDKIVTNYNASITKKLSKLPPKVKVATYVLNYQKGKVVVIGIYSDDVIANKKFDHYFNSLLLQSIKRR